MVRQGMGPIPVGQQFRMMKNYKVDTWPRLSICIL